MTTGVPDKLVQAAAEAGHRAWTDSPHPVHGKELWEHISRAALQAAFAELPECGAAVKAVAKDLQQDWYIEGQRVGDPPEWQKRQAKVGLTALAREFGGLDVVQMGGAGFTMTPLTEGGQT